MSTPDDWTLYPLPSQVFQQDEQPTFDSVFKSNNGSEKTEEKQGKKSFVGDDGVRYRFNQERQGWEAADSGRMQCQNSLMY